MALCTVSGLFLFKGSQLSSVAAMAAIVAIMIVPAVLFAVSPVVMPAVTVAVGINNAARRRFHNHNTGWWRWSMIMPVTMPVAVVIARIVRTIGTG